MRFMQGKNRPGGLLTMGVVEIFKNRIDELRPIERSSLNNLNKIILSHGNWIAKERAARAIYRDILDMIKLNEVLMGYFNEEN